MLDEIIRAIEISFEDYVLNKNEKKGIKHLLEQSGISFNSANVLRSEIFKLAQSKANASNYPMVINWLEDMNKVILSVQKHEAVKESVYFTPGEACLDAILYHIRQTKKVMEICLFTISDDRITDALLEKHERGVHIKIISDNDKVHDRGSDICRLNRGGIPVKVDRTPNHMHHKFAVFDKKTLLTGSYNWTRSAEKYNHENLLVSDSRTLCDEYLKEFNRLWDKMSFIDDL